MFSSKFKGNFGLVKKGLLKTSENEAGTEVAVKTLHGMYEKVK